MDKSSIRKIIEGNPKIGIAGLQNDWWTNIAPDIQRSYGSYLYDISGIKYLDMCGFLSSAPIRFDHPRLRKKSFIEKIGEIASYRASLSDFWTEEMAIFIKIFREFATPSYLHHFFFVEGGSLAVENALKASFDWKVRLNIHEGKIKNNPQEELQPLGTKVIYFDKGFHGRSGYSLSATHTHDPRKYKYFPRFGWFRIDPPVLQFDNAGQIINSKEVEEKQQESIVKITDILEHNSDDIAAIIIEPIQCEGGDRHIPKNFFSELRRIADKNDLILIYDEVQTGFGTTGKMWAHEHFGKDALPDIITFSKKAQIGGIISNYNKFSVIENNVFGNYDECKSRLNSTWGGNPVDMIRSSMFLKIIHEENLLENAEKVGQFLLVGIRNLCNEFSSIISNPRGRGMLISFDVNVQELNEKLCSSFYNQHLLCLTCGSRTLRFRPHLDLTLDEAEDALFRIRKALKIV